jgi:hypothetical protein
MCARASEGAPTQRQPRAPTKLNPALVFMSCCQLSSAVHNIGEATGLSCLQFTHHVHVHFGDDGQMQGAPESWKCLIEMPDLDDFKVSTHCLSHGVLVPLFVWCSRCGQHVSLVVVLLCCVFFCDIAGQSV